MRLSCAGLLLSVILLTSCEDREIKVYQMAKETVSAPSDPELPGPASTEHKPDWTTPATWKELPGSGMRAASFSVEKSSADISIVTFPGKAGGLLSNINRWRGQMGLPDQSDESGVENLIVATQPVQIVELTSLSEDKAMLGAIYLRDDQSWFVKLTGTKSEVAAQKENFHAFATSFVFPNDQGDAKKSTNDG